MRYVGAVPLLAAIAAAPYAQAAIVQSATSIIMSSRITPVMTIETPLVTAVVRSDSVANGTLDFTLNSLPVAGCTNLPLVPQDATSSAANCNVTVGVAGVAAIGASYGGDPYHLPSSGNLNLTVVPSQPGTATVSGDPNFTVTGATKNGSSITNFTPNTAIQLSASASNVLIDFDHLNLAPGAQLSIRPAAPGQSVTLYNWDPNPSIIAGALFGQAAGAIDPPAMDIESAAGMYLRSTGSISNYPGLRLDFLSGSYFVGNSLVNDGQLDGGNKLEVYSWEIHGNGDFAGNDTKFHTYGNANNPTHGNNFLLNYLNLKPGTGVPPIVPDIRFTINAYGTSPQVYNVKLNGSSSLWMPSAWPVSLGFPPNNAVIPAGGTRPAGVADPAYGGGSLLVQSTGALQLFDGGPSGTKDFTFPGAIVLISSSMIDLRGVTVNQGWAKTGKPFQGIFMQAPIIQNSQGTMKLYGNAQNWINMSTVPISLVNAFTLQTNQDGSASYLPSDGMSTHLNNFTDITNAAASGQCWTCLLNLTPYDWSGPHP